MAASLAPPSAPASASGGEAAASGRGGTVAAEAPWTPGRVCTLGGVAAGRAGRQALAVSGWPRLPWSRALRAREWERSGGEKPTRPTRSGSRLKDLLISTGPGSSSLGWCFVVVCFRFLGGGVRGTDLPEPPPTEKFPHVGGQGRRAFEETRFPLSRASVTPSLSFTTLFSRGIYPAPHLLYSTPLGFLSSPGGHGYLDAFASRCPLPGLQPSPTDDPDRVPSA